MTPLAFPDGRVVLVNRGWVAQQASRSVLPEAPPPAGEVTVQGRISIPADGLSRVAARIDRAVRSGRTSIRRDLPRRRASPCCPWSIEATAAPVPDDGLVRAWPAPDFGVETHRIYMVQWYAFALLAAVAVALVPSPAAAGRRRPMHDRRHAAGRRARTVAASACAAAYAAADRRRDARADRRVVRDLLFLSARARGQLRNAAADGADSRRRRDAARRIAVPARRICAAAGCSSRTGGGDCDAGCERRLYATRQARTMQGKEQERIVRLFLQEGDAAPSAALLAQHPGLVVVRVPASVAAKFPDGAKVALSHRSARQSRACATPTIRTSRESPGI